MLLANKNAVIYGAGGSLGGAVARGLAAEGAHVYLTGRTLNPVKRLADEIGFNGGRAEAAEVDALNEQAVMDHLLNVGIVDISYNAIGWQDTQNIPLTGMTTAEFLRPVRIAMESMFITTIAAGRVMMKQRSGVILSLTATPGGIGYPLVGGFGPACCAVEGFSRNLAAELGPYGIRVVNIRSAGSPDSRVFREATVNYPEEMKTVIGKLEDDTMLKKLPAMRDIANTAVFLASDMAGKITGVTIDVSCGTVSALNYRALGVPFPG